MGNGDSVIVGWDKIYEEFEECFGYVFYQCDPGALIIFKTCDVIFVAPTYGGCMKEFSVLVAFFNVFFLWIFASKKFILSSKGALSIFVSWFL